MLCLFSPLPESYNVHTMARLKAAILNHEAKVSFPVTREKELESLNVQEKKINLHLIWYFLSLTAETNPNLYTPTADTEEIKT